MSNGAMTRRVPGGFGSECRIVVLVSGRGSNLQALIDMAKPQGGGQASSAGRLPISLVAVISNVPGALALERAALARIPAVTLPHRGWPSRADYESALAERIESFTPDLVVLAGFMRILGSAFVRRFEGRLLNVHPSLLPRFPGLDTHARVLADGEKVHGATVHFVTEGPVDKVPLSCRCRCPFWKMIRRLLSPLGCSRSSTGSCPRACYGLPRGA